jgi:lipopolysaccharide export system protein LptC
VARADAVHTEGLRRSLAWAAVLAVFAAITGWIAWLQRDALPDDAFVGPPRSDYVLSDFTLAALDDQGKLAFEVEAPRMAKHPWLDTFAIDAPRFRIIDGGQRTWKASARTGWVSADAKELRLNDAVAADRVPAADSPALSLRTERLAARLDTHRMTSDVAVTLTQPGLILRGVGLDADLKQNQFALLADVKARYEKPR